MEFIGCRRVAKQFDCFITDRVTCSYGGKDDIATRQLMNIEWKKITSEMVGGKFTKYFPHIFTPFMLRKLA